MADTSHISANHNPIRHADVAIHVVNAILHALRFTLGLWLVLWILYDVFPMTQLVFRDFDVEEPWYLQPTHAASRFVVVHMSPVAAVCLMLVVIYAACMLFCRWRGVIATLFDVLSSILLACGVGILISIVTAVQQDLMPLVGLMLMRLQ